MPGLFFQCYTRLPNYCGPCTMTVFSDSINIKCHCRCTAYLVTLFKNFKFLYTKNRTEIKIKGPNWNRSVVSGWWHEEGEGKDSIIHFFQRSDASYNVHPPIVVCLNFHYVRTFSNCSDSCTLHVYLSYAWILLVSLKFQVFPHFFSKTTPWSKIVFNGLGSSSACLNWT